MATSMSTLLPGKNLTELIKELKFPSYSKNIENFFLGETMKNIDFRYSSKFLKIYDHLYSV